MPRLVVLVVVLFCTPVFTLPSAIAAKPEGDAKKPDDATARIERALDAPATSQYRDTPLGDVAMDLSLRHKITVKIDEEALADEGLSVETPIRLQLKDVPLAATLNQMLPGRGLDWTVVDEILLITTPAGAEQHAATKVYTMAELAAKPGFNYDELQEILQRMTAYDSWTDVGGTVGAVHAVPQFRSLIVTQTYRTHRELQALLALLNRPEAERNKGDISNGAPMYARDKIDEALRTRTEVHYLDTKLKDVVSDLKLRHPLDLEIDAEALDAAGPGANMAVNLMLRDVPLYVVLNRMLHPRGLDWTVVDGRVLLTSKDVAKSRAFGQVREYPIGDLVDVDDWEVSAAKLVDALTSVVTNVDWRDASGETADLVAFAATKSLLVRHDEQGHRALASLLRQLREAGQTVNVGAKQPEPLTTRFYPLAELDAAIRAGEKEPITNGRQHFIDDTSVIARTLLREVRPDSWQKNPEGDGPWLLVDRLTRSLVVRQTSRGHKDVAAFLQKVRGNLSGWTDPSGPIIYGTSNPMPGMFF